MKTNIYNITDKLLHKKLLARIRWDIRVSNSDIVMQVKNGCVTLFGYFDKPFRHKAAMNVISSTEGVQDIEDKSKTLGDYFRTDLELESLVAAQLLNIPLTDSEWLDIEVCNGVAKLEGYVSRPQAKAQAARAVWELSGIKDCINLIDIRNAPDDIQKLIPHYPSASLALAR